ncbi:L-aspartate oxidase [Sodalis endosymbiont of Henestaris halophilus]|uniref:L-aspartate oxidase n=1 Tax=Sodalis endosymbiont of Henestaris halophilus TaxID=1929246 RepID=UPI000BE39EF3|nr:L-aspartate oxidase [Sodalis endosymbiont of Henestaris halophilus]
MPLSTEYIMDVLVIGSGAAGLSLALRLAEHCRVMVLSKGPLYEGSTLYAQGGIAAVFDENDSIDFHVDDTLIAGAGLCDRKAVEFITSNARHCVQWLINQGVLFDIEAATPSGHRYHLNREGGHSRRRILHAEDATGRAVATTLVSKVVSHQGIQILEHCNAVDLITSTSLRLSGGRRVIGAYIWNCLTEQVEMCRARVVVLATGGASKVYQYTTNPDIATGDGIAMAWRAGCRIANLEFNQFHPTSLFHLQARNFLLTEALRGEGAYLRRSDGSRFMPDFDARAELAPRDIIARAIDHEMKRLGAACMYLDISHQPKAFIRQHFPNIYNKLLTMNIDLTNQPIPIVPAAHYTCGGVMVDQQGLTDLENLYAIGEVSYTGMHGANRLASNSLLECLVYSWSAAEDILRRLPNINQARQLPLWNDRRFSNSDEEVVLQHNWQELRLFMWNYVGIIRTTKRLERALHRSELLMSEINEYYSNFRTSKKLLEMRNLVQVAYLIIKSAQQRKESRGLHFTLDYPDMLPNPQPTILQP